MHKTPYSSGLVWSDPKRPHTFVVKNITKVPMGVIYSGVYPFLIALVLCVVLLFIFPELVLYLPSVLMK